MGVCSLVWVSALLSFFIFTFGAEYDLTIEVEGGKTHCYYQPVTDPSHVAMEVDYQVFISHITLTTVEVKTPQKIVRPLREAFFDTLFRLFIKNTRNIRYFCTFFNF